MATKQSTIQSLEAKVQDLDSALRTALEEQGQLASLALESADSKQVVSTMDAALQAERRARAEAESKVANSALQVQLLNDDKQVLEQGLQVLAEEKVAAEEALASEKQAAFSEQQIRLVSDLQERVKQERQLAAHLLDDLNSKVGVMLKPK